MTKNDRRDKNILRACFPFIRDNIELCAEVNIQTGKQVLVARKFYPKTGNTQIKDKLTCIHTAVTSITPEEFSALKKSPDKQKKLYKKTLKIRSTENLREINLSPDEKFKAFRSWVQGIAESGYNAFAIQENIDLALGQVAPIAKFLFRFIVKAIPDFMLEFFQKLELECKFNGKWHTPSLLGNIIPFIPYIKKNKTHLEMFMEMDFPLQVYNLDARIRHLYISKHANAVIERLDELRVEFLKGMVSPHELRQELKGIELFITTNKRVIDYSISLNFGLQAYTFNNRLLKCYANKFPDTLEAELNRIKSEYTIGTYDTDTCLNSILRLLPALIINVRALKMLVELRFPLLVYFLHGNLLKAYMKCERNASTNKILELKQRLHAHLISEPQFLKELSPIFSLIHGILIEKEERFKFIDINHYLKALCCLNFPFVFYNENKYLLAEYLRVNYFKLPYNLKNITSTIDDQADNTDYTLFYEIHCSCGNKVFELHYDIIDGCYLAYCHYCEELFTLFSPEFISDDLTDYDELDYDAEITTECVCGHKWFTKITLIIEYIPDATSMDDLMTFMIMGTCDACKSEYVLFDGDF
ncbi:MAG: hypothetical protein GF364_16570 [Candidatus Lokiarchaeota archaeon]|nr:hypothetical protein [Candidatus Lokiarchaeota archaeon]